MAQKRTTRSTPATTTTTPPVTNAQLKALIDQGVADAFASRDADRSRNGDDSHNSRTGSKRIERTARECTYTDFLKCQPLNFKGTKGNAGLSQWFERMESIFHISNCVVENQVKFATCTIHLVALTWWNTHVKTVGHDAAYNMTWKTLMKMMTDKYYPRNEIKKLEIEIWDLKVKGTDLTSYTQRFQELALLCGRMFPEESDKFEKYVGGLPDMIHGSVMASKPKTMQDAIEIATELMDKRSALLLNVKLRIRGNLITTTKLNNNLPKSKCTVKCANCKRVGHLTRDCRSPAATNNRRNPTCYECGNQRAREMVHALGGGEINQDLNSMEDDINA
ncbi:reverse transcriptase domain-containing protein [Tanacetum coccineum]